MDESASFQRGSPGGKKLPMSPAETAPSSASVMACSSTSPSEWPASPSGCSICKPPMRSGTPGLNSCESHPQPTLRLIFSFSSICSLLVLRPCRILPRTASRSTNADITLLSAPRFLALREEKLRKIEVALLGDFQVFIRSGNHRDLRSRPLDDRRLVGSGEAVGLGLG